MLIRSRIIRLVNQYSLLNQKEATSETTVDTVRQIGRHTKLESTMYRV